jgi:phosphomannomutase
LEAISNLKYFKIVNYKSNGYKFIFMSLFHQYDIRGVYGAELDEGFAYSLGKIILQYTKAKRIVIGYDSRIGNLKLFSAFSKAIIEQGIDVTHIGLVTRPMLNWVAWKKKFDLGVIITASHNPKEYNGFKFIWKNKPLHYDNGLSDVEELMEKDLIFKKTKKRGKIISIDYIDEYVKFLSSHLSKEYKRYISKNTLRLIADCSNGAAGEIVKRFMLINDITYELLFSHPDGTFYGHNPNPLDSGAPIVLSRKIGDFKAHFGFILDPDGDRIRFVDDKGQVIDNNYVDCMIAEHILRINKRAKIVHDVVSRRILSEIIRKNNGVSIVSKVGTSNIINQMVSEKAIFGCEVSGHRYFNIMNNQDSGMMTLVYLLNTLSDKKFAGKKLSSLWKKYDKYVDLGELNYNLNDASIKSSILDSLMNYYSKNKRNLGIKKIYNIDGINIVANDYWFTVRASNTEPLIRVRIEGKNIKKLLSVKKQLEKLIKK